MEIQISGRHMNVTDAMEERIYKYAQKLPRFDDGLISMKVTLGVDKGLQSAEVVASARHATYVAKDESHDLYDCIRKTFEKLETQITRHNDKVKNHRVTELHEPAEGAAAEEEEEEAEE